MFEKFSNLFGGGSEKETSAQDASDDVYNRFTDAQTPEGRALTGRTAEVSDDVTRAVESGTTPEERAARIRDGVLGVMEEYGMKPGEVLGMQEFFTRELTKRGVLSEKDARFDMSGMVSDVLREIARKEAA